MLLVALELWIIPMRLDSLETSHAAQGLHLRAATSFYARTVVDRRGRVLGSITDLIVELERGRVAYAVLAVGGFIGIGERLFAVPWDALRACGQQFILDRGEAALERAPAFDREHGPVAAAYGSSEGADGHDGSRSAWE